MTSLATSLCCARNGGRSIRSTLSADGGALPARSAGCRRSRRGRGFRRLQSNDDSVVTRRGPDRTYRWTELVKVGSKQPRTAKTRRRQSASSTNPRRRLGDDRVDQRQAEPQPDLVRARPHTPLSAAGRQRLSLQRVVLSRFRRDRTGGPATLRSRMSAAGDAYLDVAARFLD